jgi:hypothetical protein
VKLKIIIFRLIFRPDELGKVFDVVQDKLERALVENPDSLEQLEMEILQKRFSYFNMQKVGF